MQADGKILIAGISVIAGHSDFALVRYNADGSLDTSFDGDGKVTTDFGIIDVGKSVTVQIDGKILVAGYVYNGTTNDDFAIVRYNSNGSLDTSFDGDGKVTTAIGSYQDYGNEVLLQSDGKIIVVGDTYNGSNYDIALVRYNADGTLDTTFDGDGKQTTDFGGANDSARSAILQADGKLLVVGTRWSGGTMAFELVRYNANGSLDTTFDGDGQVTTTVGLNISDVNSVALQSDGKIVVAGISNDGNNQNFALVRYNADGSLDTTFDGDGKVVTDLGTDYEQCNSVVVQADGKIVAAGFVNDGFVENFVAVRYNSDGSLDTTFGSIATLNGTPSYTENGSAVVLDSNVQIVDADLAAAGNYSGATLTLARNGGANVQDVFSNTGTLGVLAQGGNLTIGGTTIGTVTSNSGGTLTLTFNSSATQSLVNSAMQQIAYSNSSDVPPASAQINWMFSDGNSGVQGAGGALVATGSITVSITNVNDAPTGTVTITGINQSGHTLNAGNTLSDADGLGAISYQWQSTIDHGGTWNNVATGSSLALTDLLLGAELRVVASYTDGGGHSESISSIATSAVVGVGGALTASGKVTTDIASSSNDEGRSVVVQTDGKILVAGISQDGTGFHQVVVRYLSDGTLDGTFDSDGVASSNMVNGMPDWFADMAIQSDGKILAVSSNYTGSANEFRVVRFNQNGSIDTSFDSDGVVNLSLGSLDNRGRSIAVQADGKILVSGQTGDGTGNSNDLALARLNPNGSLDTSFSGDGLTTTNFGLSEYQAGSGLVVQADGKILLAGFNTDHSFCLARYSADGSLDLGFDNDGLVTTHINLWSGVAEGISLQQDGKILVSGYTHDSTDTYFVLVRYNTDGSLDAGFGAGGYQYTNFGQATSIAVQADGKILVAGMAHNGTNSDFAMARYNSDGSLDSGFGVNGKVTTPIGTFDDYAYDVSIQADGKILLTGQSGHSSDVTSANWDFAVVRYNTDGSLDTTFGAAVIPHTYSGTAGNDTLIGAASNDLLSGGAGNDLLTGNGGFDTFRFDTALNASNNIDTITDFSVADDTLQLANSVFTALTATGELATDMFHGGAGVTTAADANDHLIYNSTTGALYYDPDGTGAAAAVQFATLNAALALTAGNFVVS